MRNIFDVLPMGRNSTPITRERLAALLGVTDRQARDEIAKAKQVVPVINVGKGYYIATDPNDPNLIEYIRKEKHRIGEINKGLQKHLWLYRFDKKQETLDL